MACWKQYPRFLRFSNQMYSDPFRCLSWIILLLLLIYRLVDFRPIMGDEVIRYDQIHSYSWFALSHLGQFSSSVHDPFGFLIGTKFLHAAVPVNKYTFRLFPFFCAIISAIVFAKAAGLVLGKTASRLSLGLFVLSPFLIRYSAFLGPYTLDVAVCAGLLILFLRMQTDDLSRPHRLIVYGLLGGTAIWTSLPSVFILSGAGLALALGAISNHDVKRLNRLIVVGAFWLGSFMTYFFVNLQFFVYRPHLLVHWAEQLFPHATSIKNICVWIWIHFMDMFRKPAGMFPRAAIPVFAWGVIKMFHRRPEQAAMLTFPFIMVLGAAVWHKYPLYHRVMMFLLPQIYILIGYGWQEVYRWEKRYGRPIIGCALALILLVQPVRYIHQSFNKPGWREGIEPLWRSVQRQWQPDDGLYICSHMKPMFDVFKDQVDLTADKILHGPCQKEGFFASSNLAAVRHFNRLWIVMFKIGYRDRFHVKPLMQSLGEPLYFETWGWARAGLYSTENISLITQRPSEP